MFTVITTYSSQQIIYTYYLEFCNADTISRYFKYFVLFNLDYFYKCILEGLIVLIFFF